MNLVSGLFMHVMHVMNKLPESFGNMKDTRQDNHLYFIWNNIIQNLQNKTAAVWFFRKMEQMEPKTWKYQFTRPIYKEIKNLLVIIIYRKFEMCKPLL